MAVYGFVCLPCACAMRCWVECMFYVCVWAGAAACARILCLCGRWYPPHGGSTVGGPTTRWFHRRWSHHTVLPPHSGSTAGVATTRWFHRRCCHRTVVPPSVSPPHGGPPSFPFFFFYEILSNTLIGGSRFPPFVVNLQFGPVHGFGHFAVIQCPQSNRSICCDFANFVRS